ncbi:MAG: hypothetical protein ACPLRH_01785, partial [Desulfotomaculales bacterium]
TGETGLVVENKRGFSLRPRVRVFFDGGGSPVKPYELSLWECRDVVVAGVVDETAGGGRLDNYHEGR